MCKLNLGRFNQCVDHLMDKRIANYDVDSDMRVFYCSGEDGTIQSEDLITGDSIDIPIFSVGYCSEEGRVDNSKIVANSMAHIELYIIAKIDQIVKTSKIPLQLDNIRIPVRSIQFYNDDKCDGCYGWVEVGVAIIVPKEEKV